MKTIQTDLGEWINRKAEPFGRIADADLDALIDRIGDARVVLIGEASHGTSDFLKRHPRAFRRWALS